MVRPPRRIAANLRYLAALLARFRVTVALATTLIFVVPFLYVWLFRFPDGAPLRYGEAVHHVYFLFYGQPSLPYSDVLLLEALNVLIPPLGIAVIADGVVRFAYLFFAKHRSDKEWIEVISKTLRDHVVICGAGRVGYRVASELLILGKDVVVVEKNEEAAFVGVLRDRDIPVLIDDVKSPHCLPRTNIGAASAIVCATDDDLANMNIALDARKLNPDIRVVMRLFDDDLVAKVRDAFRAEALSSSALAAPAMALAALDPRISHSFHVGTRLMVVSEFTANRGLPGMKLGRLREHFGAHVLLLQHASGELNAHPGDANEVASGDVMTIQAEYSDYMKLRAFTDESKPPVSSARA